MALEEIVSAAFGAWRSRHRPRLQSFGLQAVAAMLVGVLPNLPGFLHTAFPLAFPHVAEIFQTLYTYAWFVGLALAAVVYGLLMKLRKSPRASLVGA